MRVIDFLSLDAIIADLQATTKAAALGELATCMAKLEPNVDAEQLRRVLEERELLASTAIGDGIEQDQPRKRHARSHALRQRGAHARAGPDYLRAARTPHELDMGREHIVAPAGEIRIGVIASRFAGAVVVESKDIAARAAQPLREHAVQPVKLHGLAAEGIAEQHGAARRHRGIARVERAEQSAAPGAKVDRQHVQQSLPARAALGSVMAMAAR